VLTIKLAEPLSKGNSICITIKYSAGIYDGNYALGRKPKNINELLYHVNDTAKSSISIYIKPEALTKKTIE
jgi:hypothetical protein